jgi:hypothetical protein
MVIVMVAADAGPVIAAVRARMLERYTVRLLVVVMVA